MKGASDADRLVRPKRSR